MKNIYIFTTTCLLALCCSCQHNDKKNYNGALAKEDTSTWTDFNFFVLGDWGRRGEADQRAVAAQMIAYAKRRHPAFIITTGDNFYQEGVRSVTDPHWTQSFTNVYKELTRDYNWYAVLGNHDYEGSANPQAEIDYHRVNPHWNMPGYYSTLVTRTPDSQSIRFLFIDTNPFDKEYYTNGGYPMLYKQDTAKQRRWIAATLDSAKEQWKFVVGHHPVYSAGSDHGITPELMQLLRPVMEKDHVQAYICGHEHNLQHERLGRSYVDYFICGAGSEVNPVGRNAETKFALSEPGFADIRIKGDSLTLQFIDKKGHVVYSYGRKK